MSTNGHARAWIEVRASALRRNLATIMDGLPVGTRAIPMVKADGYGLGMLQAVQALRQTDPLAWGVATFAEGQRLRAAEVDRDVIVFSPIPPPAIPDAVHEGLTVTVSSLDALQAVIRTSTSARFHVEVDTGMGRSGFDCHRVAAWGPAVKAAAARGNWVGCFTHFHSADQSTGHSVERQYDAFRQTLAELEAPVGEPDFVVHTANSAAALRLPEALGLGPGSAVRPGIFLYGGRGGEGLPPPEPVASLRARIGLVRDVPAGTTLGYGATYRAQGPERWATVGLGYGDGLPRALSNRGTALVHGRPAAILGRISMDVSVVDITGLDDVKVGDLVTFMGTEGDACLTPDDLAGVANTISYEILTGFTTRLPRIWMDDGE